ncbi:MAG: enoyl-CoA hydratase-related protein [Pseudomonadota bacterium]
MTQDCVLYEVSDGVAVVTLNEPERMNALSESLQAGLLDAMDRIRADSSVRAMLFTARGRGFCSGADLKDFSRRSAQLQPGDTLGQYVGRMMETTGNVIANGLATMPVPVVCAVNGAVAGGGVGLALACDIVIAARSAMFYLPFVPALGIVPDMGSTWTLLRSVGRARGMGLALCGDKLSADKAAEWGLIWSCVADEQLQAQAMDIARRMAALPGHAIAETRALFEAAETNTFAQHLALERERQQVLIDGESFAEGVRAFMQRRAPEFRGR